jgi:hypothetical protein
MACWQFPVWKLRSCGSTNAAELRIEIAVEDRRVWHTVDWTSPYICTGQPFENIPEVGKVLEAEVGTVGGGAATFQCNNLPIYTSVLTGTVRLWDLLNSVHPLDYQYHLRVWRKPVGGSDELIAWYTVAVEDMELTMADDDDPDTWRFQIQAVNAIHQLDEHDADVTFFNTYLDHATYDHAPASILISSPYGPGMTMTRLPLNHILHYDGAVHTWIPATDMRFFKLTDVLQAISNGIGLTTDVNNGAATEHSWEFLSYGGGADQIASFDDLYVPSCVYFASEYQHDFGLFDPEEKSDASFYSCGTLLEMLKAILVPFGMVARIAFTAAGARYLEFCELDADSGSSFAMYAPGIKFKPASRMLGGINVSVPDSYEVRIGSGGDSSTSIKCNIMTAQRIARFNRGVDATDDLTCLYRSLFVDTGGGVFENIYKINVKSAGAASSYGAGLTARYHDDNAGSVLAAAAARYWYNPYSAPATDPVGIYRRVMRRLEITVPRFVPDSELDVREYIDFQSRNWRILEKKWNLNSGFTTFICECGDW